MSVHSPTSGMRTMSKTYDGMLQLVLQRRALNAAAWSFAVTSGLFLIATFSFNSPVYHLRLATPIWLLFAVTAGVLPSLILQHALLSPSKQGYMTRISQLRNLATAPSTYIAAVVYTSSSAAIAFAFVCLSAPSTKISVFKPTMLYPWHLNERFVFLLGGNMLLGLVLAARSVYLQTAVVPWRRSLTSTQQTRWRALWLALYTSATSLFKITIIISCVYVVMYLALRKSLFRLGLFVFKPFVHNFLRSRLWVITPSVCWWLIRCNLAAAFSMHFAETYFALSASEPVLLTQFANNPTTCLIGGIASTASKGCNRHFAVAELSEIAQNSKLSARRKAIFSDIHNSFYPSGKNAWSAICRELLLILGRDYQTLLTRGKSRIPAPVTPGNPSTPQVVAKTTSALKQAEYASSHRSTQDHILDLAASSLQSAENVFINQVPQIYNKGSVSLSTLSSAHPASTEGVREVVASVAGKVQRPSTMMPSWATVQAQMPSVARSVFSMVGNRAKRDYSGFVAETIARRLSTALPNATLDTMAIQALCHLTAASFLEDPYGTVQKDIPRILEALLRFQQTLEEFQHELNDPLCEATVEPVRNALGTGLHTIIVTFSDRLSAFRFAPMTAKRLQDLIDNAG